MYYNNYTTLYKTKFALSIISLLISLFKAMVISYIIYYKEVGENLMEIEQTYKLRDHINIKRQNLLRKAGLNPEDSVDYTVLLWDGEFLVATGSRHRNVLKCIAVDEQYQGQNLTARLLTSLRQEAFLQNIGHLFLYTRPDNKSLFESIAFYTVTQTKEVLLMEDEKDGVKKYISGLRVPCRSGVIGSAVMNCNPFTLGHQYLIEEAASECDWLYVFIVSEEQGVFSAKDRLQLAIAGTANLKNVTVQLTGPYLISSATFPDYFIADKDRKEDIHCRLDIQIFTEHYAPAFNILRRYVGSEPFSSVTRSYNETLRELLPGEGIEYHEIARIEKQGVPISASYVRAMLEQGRVQEIRDHVPITTFEYLKNIEFQEVRKNV